MYWSLQNSEENNTPEASPAASADGEHESDVVDEVSNLAIDDDNAAEDAS